MYYQYQGLDHLFYPNLLNDFLSKFDGETQSEAIVYLPDFFYSLHIHIANQNVGFKYGF